MLEINNLHVRIEGNEIFRGTNPTAPVNALRARADLTPRNMLKETIDQVLMTLRYREREIIKLRYGLGDGYYYYTREEVGRIFRLRPYDVQKIEGRAIRKLQHPVRSRQLEEFSHILVTGCLTDPEGYFYLLQEVIGSYSNQWEPNLFDYATSELSQDAFVCWLIAWADPSQHANNAVLHQTAVRFLDRLLEKHGIDSPAPYEKLEIKKQYPVEGLLKGWLDILVLVNRDIALLIEDKTNTSEHSDQLRRYLDGVQKDFPGRRLAPVYLKLGGDQTSYQSVEDIGWKYFKRRDLLNVLAYGKQHGVASDIFRDFHSRLMHMDLKSWSNRFWRSP